MTRRFEMVEGGSRKFWEIAIEGCTVTVRFGRIGTDGQTKPKDLGSPDAAAKEAAKLVAEKTKKGYVEIGVAATASVPTPSAPTATAPTPSAPAQTPPAADAPAQVGPTVPTSPMFSRLYLDGAHQEVAWSCISTDRRRRVDPDIGSVVAAIVRGWAVEVRSREEAESLLARVRALPGEAPCEPAAVLAYPGWEIDESRPRTIVIGAILAARCSDSGRDSDLAGAKGPGGAPLGVIRARQLAADEWLGGAFPGVDPATASPPSDFFVTAGDMGDAYLALGALGGKVAGLPFSKRTADANGKKHFDGIAGVRLAHASWDESCCVPIDLSDAALSEAMAMVSAVVAKPLIVLGAHYDSRS
jgi:predicted DNA-binding WGR domain protein